MVKWWTVRVMAIRELRLQSNDGEERIVNLNGNILPTTFFFILVQSFLDE
jgi:hypothetical protein